MKGIKKLLTGILAATMIMGASLTAYATAPEGGQEMGQESGQQTTAAATGSVTVKGCIPGEEYSLYKLLDFESAGTTGGVYTIKTSSPWWNFIDGKADVKDGQATGHAGVLTLTKVTDTTDTYYVSWTAGAVATDESRAEALADVAGVQAFAKDAIAYAINNNISAVASDTAGTAPEGQKPTVVFSGLSLGYYLVGSSAGALVSLDTTNTAAEVNEKNDIPSTEKKVEEDSTGNYGDKDDADIGQVVKYRSTVTIPAGGAKNVVFYDKMTDSLTFSGEEKVVVKNGDTVLYNGTDNANVTVAEGGSVVDADGNTVPVTFVVTFDSAYTESLTAETVITIEYSATLNENAIIYGKETSSAFGGGNDNESMITYGNAGKSKWDWTRTYTYPVDIKKVDPAKNVLPGAEFNLALNTDTNRANLFKFTQVNAGSATAAAEYRVDPNGTVTTLVTPKSGLIHITGLDADVYSLKETKAPDGYNLLATPIVFTIDSNTDTAQGDDGKSQGVTVKYTKDNLEYTGALEVENKTGVLLPSTGGIGTTIFYIIGGILIVAGVAYFIVRRKANAQ